MNGIENLTGIKSFELSGVLKDSSAKVSGTQGEVVTETQKQSIAKADDEQAFIDKIKSDTKMQKQVATEVEKYINNSNLSVRFGIDKESGKQFFKIVDVVENKVVKQFPPEEILELAKKLKSLDGSLVDTVV